MKMSALLALLLMASCQPHGSAGEADSFLIGHYSGFLEFKGKKLAASIDFDTARGEQIALLSVPANLQLEKPFDEVRYSHPQLSLRMKDGEGSVSLNALLTDDGALLKGKLDGPLPASVRMERGEKRALSARYVTWDTTVANGSVSLPARLFLPNASKPVPGIIMICGTGNHSREEYYGWADLFANKGIAVVVFDKRNVTDRGGRKLRYVNSDITSLDELLGDAEAAYAVLKPQPGVDTTHIGVMGFSLGAIEVPVLAVRNPGLSFLIAVSGNATTDEDYLVYQGLKRYEEKGFNAATRAKASQLYEMLFEFVRTKQDRDQLQAALDGAYREGWGQLCFPREVPNEDEIAYLLGWNNLDFDPAVYWKQVSIPSLVVYGEKDRYIPVDSSVAILDRIFARKKHLLTLRRYPGTDHTIRTIPSKDDFDFPAYPVRYPAEVVSWVLQQTARASRD